MLEEIGATYELQHVDLMQGEQKSAEHRALNPMGKVPVLIDGDAVVDEAAAIAVYLADRYAAGVRASGRPGVRASDLDDPRRGVFLRWCF